MQKGALEARAAWNKDIVNQRMRMAQGLEDLENYVLTRGPIFDSVDDFQLYYWLLEMKAYFEKGFLPGEVELQLREVGFPFDCDVKLSPELSSQVKPPRKKKRYAYENMYE